MTDYTLIVHRNIELTKWDEYNHVAVHGIRDGCLYIHYVNKSEPTIIPLHAFYEASVLEK